MWSLQFKQKQATAQSHVWRGGHVRESPKRLQVWGRGKGGGNGEGREGDKLVRKETLISGNAGMYTVVPKHTTAEEYWRDTYFTSFPWWGRKLVMSNFIIVSRCTGRYACTVHLLWRLRHLRGVSQHGRTSKPVKRSFIFFSVRSVTRWQGEKIVTKERWCDKMTRCYWPQKYKDLHMWRI